MYIKIILLFGMLFCHIVDDYYLQGILSSMKQKSWWKQNAPDKLYSKDYIMALLEHAFSWTFMIMIIPVLYTMHSTNYITEIMIIIFFIINMIIHAIIDNLKANKLSINLIEDQIVHIIQIFMTWVIFVFF